MHKKSLEKYARTLKILVYLCVSTVSYRSIVKKIFVSPLCAPCDANRGAISIDNRHFLTVFQLWFARFLVALHLK